MQRCVDTRLRMFTWVKSPQSCFFKFYFLTHLPQSYACEVQWFEIPSMKCSWKLSVYFIRKLKLMNKDLMDIELFYSFCFQYKKEEMRETRVANRKGRNVSSSSSSEPQFIELLLFTECLLATSSHSRDTQTFILFESSSKWLWNSFKTHSLSFGVVSREEKLPGRWDPPLNGGHKATVVFWTKDTIKNNCYKILSMI